MVSGLHKHWWIISGKCNRLENLKSGLDDSLPHWNNSHWHWSLQCKFNFHLTYRIISTLLFQAIRDYFLRQTSTKVTFESVPAIMFPAVTICNQNKIHCGNLYNLIDECWSNVTCQNGETLETYCDLYIYGQCEPSVNKSEIFQYGTVVSLPPVACEGFEIDQSKIPQDQNKKRAYFQAKFLAYYGRLSDEEEFRLSHSPKKMFRRCAFAGEVNEEDKDCTALMKGESRFFSPTFGMCYSFNYRGPRDLEKCKGINCDNPRWTHFSGPLYGLSLEIDMEGLSYLRNGQTEHEGIVIVLHDPRTIPLISSAAFNVLPNSATSYSINFINITRTAAPYTTNCSSSWKDSIYPSLVEMPVTYSSKLCQSMCIHDIIQADCNCSVPQLNDLRRDKVSYCNMNNESVQFCVTESFEALEELDLSKICVCPQLCEEIKYIPHISSTLWPSSHYWSELASSNAIMYNGTVIDPAQALEVELGKGTEDDLEIWDKVKEYVQENYLQINVFFEEKSVERIEEKPKTDFPQFLSNLGGAVSLYLGVSLVAIFEVLEVLVRCLMGGFKRSI